MDVIVIVIGALIFFAVATGLSRLLDHRLELRLKEVETVGALHDAGVLCEAREKWVYAGLSRDEVAFLCRVLFDGTPGLGEPDLTETGWQQWRAIERAHRAQQEATPST